MSIKQKRPNYGINEFAVRAFDYDGNVVGRFDDQLSSTLAAKHHTCPNGANVKIYFLRKNFISMKYNLGYLCRSYRRSWLP